jgi:lysozyme
MAEPAKIAAGGSLAAAATLALVMAVGALMHDEGLRAVDYRDIAGVPTACFGHTGSDVTVGKRRSRSECRTLLRTDAAAHLNGVIGCVPALQDRPEQLAAATRLSFNIGVAAFCRSTAARRFGADDWRGGCDAFLAWNKARVGGRLVVVRGLTDRRRRERAMCLTGLKE